MQNVDYACIDLKDWLAEVNTLITSAVELVTNIEQLLKAAELDKLQSKTKSLSISSDPHREVPTCKFIIIHNIIISFTVTQARVLEVL